MRHLSFLCVFGLGVIAATPAFSQQDIQPSAGSSVTSGQLPLCLGASIATCRANFESVFGLKNKEETDADIARINTVDINGHRPSVREITLYPTVSPDSASMIVTLSLDRSDKVKSVDVVLPSSPDFAATEQDYDKTYMYEAKEAVFGSACNAMDKLAVYRFFENRIKPSIKRSQREPEFWDIGVETDHVAASKQFPFCKHKISYRGDFGVDTSLINESDYSGNYNSATLSFR